MGETNKFLDTYALPRLNYKGVEHLKKPITSNEIESLIKIIPSPPTKKPQGLDGSNTEFY
jgi:hypothetical protein